MRQAIGVLGSPSRRFTMLANCLASVALLLVTAVVPSAPPETKVPSRDELLRVAIAELLKMQEKEGEWPYQGVYRVKGEIPVGYRVGGTSLVAGVLLFAAPKNKAAQEAIARGLSYVLKQLDDPEMVASTRDVYDVRVWGHCCALEFLCHIRAP